MVARINPFRVRDCGKIVLSSILSFSNESIWKTDRDWMRNQADVTLICPRCSSNVAGEDIGCGNCGAILNVAQNPNRSRKNAESALRTVCDNRWAVLGILFLVMAAFGIPLLWCSRAFSWRGKALLTILVIAYTALIVWLVVFCIRHVIEQITSVWAA